MPDFAVIIPAAGSSSRFGGTRNKLLEDLAGQPVIVRCVNAFLRRNDVRAIIIPTILADQLRAIVPADERIIFCEGGPTRAHSVVNALRNVHGSIEWVAVHDGARPLISQAVIDRTIECAVKQGAAAPAMPVSLTIKQAAGPLPARVEMTLPRQRLWAMQTPQIARRDKLLAAFQSCPVALDQITDDMQVIELASGEVWLVEGDERNLKITTQLDLMLARTLMGAWDSPLRGN
jgi:2-C-methyl-D-erythritol 4-phosphate cytidylyltransferase